MKKFLKNLAKGVYDGLQENEETRNRFSFQEIYDVILEFVSFFFMGLICTVLVCFIWAYFKISVSLGGILVLIWSLIIYYFINSTDVKNIKSRNKK